MIKNNTTPCFKVNLADRNKFALEIYDQNATHCFAEFWQIKKEHKFLWGKIKISKERYRLYLKGRNINVSQADFLDWK